MELEAQVGGRVGATPLNESARAHSDERLFFKPASTLGLLWYMAWCPLLQVYMYMYITDFKLTSFLGACYLSV